MSKRVSITPEVHDVLARATVVGTAERPVVQLPPGQLPRDLYVATDKVLKALGGKWNRGQNGHVFDRPVEGELAEALNSGVAVNQAKVAEQFFTPLAAADKVWERAQLRPEHHVLEPSAGSGNLLNAPLRLGCRITCVEQDARLADLLRPLNVEVVCADFLSLEWATPRFDRVIMNPPFSRGQDVDHVTRAYQLLLPGGLLVAIMSPHWRFADDARSKGFRHMANDHAFIWEPLPDGTFRESGTSVNTGILTLSKGTDQ